VILGEGSRVFIGPQRVQSRGLVGDQGGCVVRKNSLERLPSEQILGVTFLLLTYLTS